MEAERLTPFSEVGARRPSWQSPERPGYPTDERLRAGSPVLQPDISAASAADDCCGGCLSEETHRRLHIFVERKKILLQKLICEPPMPSVVNATARGDSQDNEICQELGSHVVLPPLEAFMRVPDIGARRRDYLSRVQPGDLVCGSVAAVTEAGLMIALLCCDGRRLRLDVADLKVVAFCAAKELPRYYSHESPVDAFSVKDKVRGVVTMADPETGKMQLSMLGRTYLTLRHDNASSAAHLPKLGLIADEELPLHYRKQCEFGGFCYSELLASSQPFSNPHSSAHLCDVLGLSRNRDGDISAPTCKGFVYSLLKSLSSLNISLSDCASSLRKEQSRRMALKSVATGVRYFKEGKHTEAAQCYYKALSIDSDNVEALVARGALFANNESYSKAIEDFEKARRLLPDHPNARSYLVQTLLAYGKEFEATGNDDRAKDQFVKASMVDPASVDAKRCLLQLESKMERDAFTCAMPPRPPDERSAAGQHGALSSLRSGMTEGVGGRTAVRSSREAAASGCDGAPTGDGVARRRSLVEPDDGTVVLRRRESVASSVSKDRSRTKRARSRSGSSVRSCDSKSGTSRQLSDSSRKVRHCIEKHLAAYARQRSGSDAASKSSSRSSSREPRHRKKHHSSKTKQSRKRHRDSSGSDSCSRTSDDDNRRRSRKQKRKKQKKKKRRHSSVRSKSTSSRNSSGQSRSPGSAEPMRLNHRSSLGETRKDDLLSAGRVREASSSAANPQLISKLDLPAVDKPALNRAFSRSSSSLQHEKEAEAVRRSSISGDSFSSSFMYCDEARRSREPRPSENVGAEDVSQVSGANIVGSRNAAACTQDSSMSSRVSQDCGGLPQPAEQQQQRQARAAALMEMELFLQQLKQKKKISSSAQ